MKSLLVSILFFLFSGSAIAQHLELFLADQKLDPSKSLISQGVGEPDKLTVKLVVDKKLKEKHKQAQDTKIIQMLITRKDKKGHPKGTLKLSDTGTFTLENLKIIPGETFIIDVLRFFVINQDGSKEIINTKDQQIVCVF